MFARLWEATRPPITCPRKIWLNTGGHGDGANSGSRQAAWRDMLNRFWSNTSVRRRQWRPRGAEGGGAAIRAASGWTTTTGRSLRRQRRSCNHVSERRQHRGRSADREHQAGQARIRDGRRQLCDRRDRASRRRQSPHRLIYQTAPLTTPVHISGIPSVALRMSFNEPAAIVSAMLIEYRANGTRTIITRGWADPQNRKSTVRDVCDSPGVTVPDCVRAAAA